MPRGGSKAERSTAPRDCGPRPSRTPDIARGQNQRVIVIAAVAEQNVVGQLLRGTAPHRPVPEAGADAVGGKDQSVAEPDRQRSGALWRQGIAHDAPSQ